MALASLIMLVPVVLVTSFLSGIFGMAGGLLLLWFLFLVAPASTAIAVHGIIQMVSNGSRAWLSRRYLDLKILAIVSLGLLLAMGCLFAVQYSPNKAIALMVIGLLPLLLWIPASWLTFDASRPSHAFACGLISGALTVMVGSAGPLIDLFFIRTKLDRRVVIATKATIQVVAHFTKVVFYINAALMLDAMGWTTVALCIPAAFLGAWLGKFVLDRMSDLQFRSWTRMIVTCIGFAYFVQGTSAVLSA
ncbi:permease [Nitratireductor aestuarii]|uniref:Probable membrane transporter protein n=1 Tax=Nitratireductor aestuarii TaxID=1735103 RepID=A0A916W5P1_9HYPH|nr:sulfite exporter TauE/SafE family protein [Nitratireductor aestuarii]GGA68942.1 permease [Nitratireductor aestuarii]